MSFSVLDSKGQDFLDPENPNGFDVSKMRLFYEINGEVRAGTQSKFRQGNF